MTHQLKKFLIELYKNKISKSSSLGSSNLIREKARVKIWGLRLGFHH